VHPDACWVSEQAIEPDCSDDISVNSGDDFEGVPLPHLMQENKANNIVRSVATYLECQNCKKKICVGCAQAILQITSKKEREWDPEFFIPLADFVRDGSWAPVNYYGPCCKHKQQHLEVTRLIANGRVDEAKLLDSTTTESLLLEREYQRQLSRISKEVKSYQGQRQPTIDGMLFYPALNLFVPSERKQFQIHGLGCMPGKYEALAHLVPSVACVIEAWNAGAYPKPLSAAKDSCLLQRMQQKLPHLFGSSQAGLFPLDTVGTNLLPLSPYCEIFAIFVLLTL